MNQTNKFKRHLKAGNNMNYYWILKGWELTLCLTLKIQYNNTGQILRFWTINKAKYARPIHRKSLFPQGYLTMLLFDVRNSEVEQECLRLHTFIRVKGINSLVFTVQAKVK
jgi:hypothetical protein